MKYRRNNMNCKIIAVFMLTIIYLSGCKETKNNFVNIPPEDLPAYLQPLDGAFDVLYSQSGNEVSYMMNEEFPAKKTIALLEKQLHENGFVKLKKTLLYPNLNQPKSWQKDELPRRDMTVMSWREEWLNSEKEFIRFSVVYHCEQSNSDDNLKPMIQIIFHHGEITNRLIEQYVEINSKEFARIVEMPKAKNSSGNSKK